MISTVGGRFRGVGFRVFGWSCYGEGILSEPELCRTWSQSQIRLIRLRSIQRRGSSRGVYRMEINAQLATCLQQVLASG